MPLRWAARPGGWLRVSHCWQVTYPRSMPRLLPFILAAALTIYALVDCSLTPRDRIPRGLPKGLWIVLILVPIVGPVAWLLVSRLQGSAAYQGPKANLRGVRPPWGRRMQPVAPDDDAEFLADLDWQMRKAEYDRKKRAQQREDKQHPEQTGHSEDDSDEPGGLYGDLSRDDED